MLQGDQQQARASREGAAILYCLVPADKPRLRELLDRHFRNVPRIKVIPERRGLDRRSGEDRRHGNATPPAGMERRRTNPEPERRARHRRAAAALVKPPVPLPPEARPFVDQIAFVERLPDSA